jgi:hypothetical protein
MKSLREVFGEIVCDVLRCWDIHDAKLLLSNPIMDPMKPHVDCFTAFLFKRIVSESNSGLVVAEDSRRGLRVAHIAENR